MNRNLVYFAFFMILLGIGSGSYVLSLLGLLVLIPALLLPTRPPARRAPVPQRPETRRIIPKQQPQPPAPPPGPERIVTVAPLPPVQQQTFSPALFPMPMFLSLSQMGTTPQPAKEPVQAKQEGRDELVEVGTILALLRLAFG